MRRRPILSLTLAGAMVAAVSATATASDDRELPRTTPAPWDLAEVADRDDVLDGRWFVEFDAAPSARGGPNANASQRANERAAFRSQAAAEDAEFTERRDFDTLFNGLAIEADLADVATLSQLDGVRAIHPVVEVEAPDPDTTPALDAALSMTGADVVGSELGLDGDGLSIAIIDSGIDYNHPDLGGSGDGDVVIEAADDRTMDHPRISHGWDYVGDEFNPADPDAPTEPQPNPDPMDLGGHGTHVAGIAGAAAADDDGLTGVAPGVTLGAYKVFGPGSTSSEAIVAALEDAYTDGFDIVNMSLGAALAWGQDYPTSQASNLLADLGVVVVNSAGNSGDLGAWTLSAPANAHDIISVASADNTEQQTAVFEVDGIGEVPYLPMADAPAPPTEGTSEAVVPIGRACVESEGDELTGDPDGAVALAVRGDCTFAEKFDAAVAAGAVGVVISNNEPGLFSGGGIEDAGDVWAAGIGGGDGAALEALALDEEVTLTFTDDTRSTVNPTGGLVSTFSSFGQDVELEFGPSVLAPGGLVTSTYPLELGGQASLSGTSMAAPHVAGAVALLLESEPDLDPLTVRDRLQNTADPVVWNGNPGLGLLEHVTRQGAGMLAIDEAITADQALAPGQLSLADADATISTVTLTNTSDAEVTYTVGHEPAVATAGSTYTPTPVIEPAAVDVADSVTVPAGGSSEVEVTVTAPQTGLGNHQYGGYVTFTADDATDLVLPYVGFEGDYLADMGLFGFWSDPVTYTEVEPVLARLSGDELTVAEPGTVFDLAAGELPVAAPFFGHFPEALEVYAVRGNGQRFLVAAGENLPRATAPGEVTPIPWDGRVAAGNSGNTRVAPPGDYRFEVRALRATGDPQVGAHWDVWESEVFRVDGRGGPGAGGPPPGRGPNR